MSWKPACQKTFSRSSTKARYRAVANATAEVLWVQYLLQEITVALQKPPSLFCDNISATYVCKNPVFHSRMKHLALDYFFVRDLVAAGSLLIQHIPSKSQITDTLTKLLGRNVFLHFRSKIGISDGSSILRGRIKDKDKMI
ncbi:cysteine-rich RLK (RECEPTOR-like protein kinase) 8 [Hibiscus trionum]|uniref:Cysteine-rich RLK (RECEPTOR-like protein kinase) 8 n=1 Tax=Hibiscus trionum TaxID=183268 RepID=A0A9W7LU28_HIBTR|nr:cysteine-rich RLK (RECEPTOR-like protein kinase) 8 [Hibiscus trionum]